MPAPSTIRGDTYFQDDVSFGGDVSFPSGSIGNTDIEASAGVDASKLEHLHRIIYAQPNTAATSVTQIVYQCLGTTGTTLEVRAGSIAIAVGAATVTVDVKKNGTTILSGVITLDTGNTNRVSESGTISVPSLVDGDVLEIVTVATAGGGTLPTGVWVAINVAEDYA
jgi:hypothetical protein